jgi:long-chain acyl-CoA synthetase
MQSSIPLMFKARMEAKPERIAQFSKDAEGRFAPVSYASLYSQVLDLASALIELGVKRGDRVGLISDNRQEWMVQDLGILALGAADVPRGCDATEQEIAYILDFSECAVAIVENSKQLEKLVRRKKDMPGLKTVIVTEGAQPEDAQAAKAAGLATIAYSELMESGRAYRKAHPQAAEAELLKGKADEVATIIFTSGTTGEPKGVVLTHANFLCQAENLPLQIDIKPDQIWLSVLPVWHSFERIMQYMILATSTSIAYSKPIGSIMLADFAAIRPHWMASVPRIWESVRDGVYRNIRQHGGLKLHLFNFFVSVGKLHAGLSNMLLWRLPNFHGRIRILDSLVALIPWLLIYPLKGLGNLLVFGKIKAKLGGRFVAGISGGGALPSQVDAFFQAVGVQLLEGYGLTETAPVVAVRASRSPKPGTVGLIMKDTQVMIVDDEGKALPPGHKGIVMVKGPQVMRGYYKKPELTAKVLSPEGWLNTGDLGMMTRENELKITGRAKDTIVLRGGENVEPAPIELKINESRYIKQSVVLGQDQRYLAALVVPEQEAVMEFAKENNIPILDYEALLAQPEINELLMQEVMDLVHPKNGFKSFERVFKIALVSKPFEVGRELSHKQEVMRHKVNELYAKLIQGLFQG